MEAATCCVSTSAHIHDLGEVLNFVPTPLRGLAPMAVFRTGQFLIGPPAMSWRALLYRRPSEPSAIEIIFDRSIFLVRLRRHRQARRYTLRIDAATREVVLTIPPRGSLKEARDFAQKHGGWIAARLRRIPEAAPFAHGVEVPLRGVPHRITHRRSQRGTVWTETTADGVRLLCVAGQPPSCRKAKRCLQTDFGSRPIEPVGLLLQYRSTLVFVAAHPGAPFRARLPRGARGRASGRAQSL